VGFIKDLPEVLLRAFIATLEELEDAELLVHLVDVSLPDFEEKMDVVEKLLVKLHLDGKKRLIVFNKVDKIDRAFSKQIENRYRAVSISCLKKDGIEKLIQAIESELVTGDTR
jgi:GTP-binding protein HflX